ncbi:MAG TPA: response regulator transcription factor [Pseudonocardiaceae bacterium]|jgi:DNA-binding NarL/FixJ family response regulator|nr:response regulator transcription factor [Pseudonocardiaceae bacterium]
MIRTMVVDDHPIWRAGVARDLIEQGFEVVATAADGAAALRIVPAANPDVVLMDLRFASGGPSGAETTRRIIDTWPNIRVLVLSASGEHADVLAAVQAGASGYLMKSASVQELANAVRRTAEGDAVFTAGLAGLLLGEYRRMALDPRTDSPRLTDRETEVLRQVALGRTARQIAEALVISHRTVENHVRSTLRKLQLHNRVELARYAIEHGLIDQ